MIMGAHAICKPNLYVLQVNQTKTIYAGIRALQEPEGEQGHGTMTFRVLRGILNIKNP